MPHIPGHEEELEESLGLMDMLSIAKHTFQTGDYEQALTLLDKDTADMAASTLRVLNQFAEDYPTTSKLTGVAKFTDWVDTKAYEFGNESGGAVRALGKDRGPSQNYTGVEDEWYSNSAPNFLNMYLRPNTNTLPMSDVEPSSWTKGTPDQGWRSIKNYSTMFTPTDDAMKDYYNKTYIPEGSEVLRFLKERKKRDKSIRRGNSAQYISKYSPEQIEEIRQKNIAQNKERALPFQEIMAAVESGAYDPNKHAIKFRSEADMQKQAPGATFQSQMDLENFTRSLGYDSDNDEYYISTTDIWDFEPTGYGETYGKTEEGRSASSANQAYIQAALMHGAGKGFGIYDRYPVPKDIMEFWAGKGSTWKDNGLSEEELEELMYGTLK